MNIDYFSHCRTALKFGLMHLNLKEGDVVHIPEFICDVILHPLNQLGLKYKYYPVMDDLSPDWSVLTKAIENDSKALLMVHYFGQPQNIKLFKSFCLERDLLLIEDNAHGYGGRYNSKLLGTFGDVGVSSPRKTLELSDGGVLYLNTSTTNQENSLSHLERQATNKYKYWLKKFFKRNAGLKMYYRKYMKERPKYWDPIAFSEAVIDDKLISTQSERTIQQANIDEIVKYRREKYFYWSSFANKHNLRPLISSLDDGACPLLFPVYTSGSDESRKWFDWGWDNGVNVYSWPSLPKELIVNGGPAFDRWSKLICFPIEENMNTMNFDGEK